MLRANYLATLPQPEWQAIGPGPDPEVMLETVVRLNGTALRLRAVRVFAPYSSGWTLDDTWELEPMDVTEEIAWDLPALKTWVKLADRLGDAAPPQPEPELSADMMALEEWWGEALDLFFWAHAEYPPLRIGTMTYQVIAYPAPSPATDAPHDLSLEDAGWGNDTGEAGFRDGVFLLAGAPFRLFGYEMLEIHDQHRVRQRSINRKDEEHIRALATFMEQPLSAGSMRLTSAAGAHFLLLMQPLAATGFCITGQPLQPAPAGQMQWYFPTVDRETAAMTEALARMVRARHMAFHENRPIIVGTEEDLDAWLPAAVHPDRRLQALRKAVTLPAFGTGCTNCHGEHVEILFQDASGSGAVFYVEPAPIAVFLFGQMQDDQLYHLLSRPGVFETAVPPENLEFPAWITQLPRMFDRQYRELWDSVSRNME